MPLKWVHLVLSYFTQKQNAHTTGKLQKNKQNREPEKSFNCMHTLGGMAVFLFTFCVRCLKVHASEAHLCFSWKKKLNFQCPNSFHYSLEHAKLVSTFFAHISAVPSENVHGVAIHARVHALKMLINIFHTCTQCVVHIRPLCNLTDHIKTIESCSLEVPKVKKEDANSKKYSLVVPFLHMSLGFYIANTTTKNVIFLKNCTAIGGCVYCRNTCHIVS